jgi:hypothetical protein
MKNHHTLIRAYGLREIAAGIGILAAIRRAPWVWSRVAGDAMDLATLGGAMQTSKKLRTKTVVAAIAVAESQHSMSGAPAA